MFDPKGEYCITNESRLVILENLFKYETDMQKNISTLETYNKTIK